MPFTPSEPTIPQEGEVRVAVVESRSEFSCCDGKYKTLSTCVVPSYDHLPEGLEQVSIHTYRSFWEEVNEHAMRLARRARIHSLMEVFLLLLIVAHLVVRFGGAPGYIDLWMLLMVDVVLVVSLCTADIECQCCYSSSNNPDDEIVKIVEMYTTKFQSQGFLVDYRKEYETRASTEWWRQKRAIMRFVRFRKELSASDGPSTSFV